jgi:hypothetical protein
MWTLVPNFILREHRLKQVPPPERIAQAIDAEHGTCHLA